MLNYILFNLRRMKERNYRLKESYYYYIYYYVLRGCIGWRRKLPQITLSKDKQRDNRIATFFVVFRHNRDLYINICVFSAYGVLWHLYVHVMRQRETNTKKSEMNTKTIQAIYIKIHIDKKRTNYWEKWQQSQIENEIITCWLIFHPLLGIVGKKELHIYFNVSIVTESNWIESNQGETNSINVI